MKQGKNNTDDAQKPGNQMSTRDKVFSLIGPLARMGKDIERGLVSRPRLKDYIKSEEDEN